ncbi:HNH endonuclease [Methanosarcina lacustris Z-7289]|uniref:HNH endonuclease n=1 Tax=Methanosarcina lacustris Z-7289 TaxID=1434111 RepID=A0A0E3S3Y4_9EURY|nr:hypothetical protein [Methanosarcina lacustris]AKB74936.1 HNH endonuclease [Methanosarcina lacustris Z-7289]
MQGINHKYCNILSRADGYEYATEHLEVDGIPPTTEVIGILP